MGDASVANLIFGCVVFDAIAVYMRLRRDGCVFVDNSTRFYLRVNSVLTNFFSST